MSFSSDIVCLISFSVVLFPSGNTRLQSSQLAETLWTDPGLKSGICLHELISALKKKAQTVNELSDILQKFSHARQKPPPPVLLFAGLIYPTNYLSFTEQNNFTLLRILVVR